jgi:hypothetical protein
MDKVPNRMQLNARPWPNKFREETSSVTFVIKFRFDFAYVSLK